MLSLRQLRGYRSARGSRSAVPELRCCGTRTRTSQGQVCSRDELRHFGVESPLFWFFLWPRPSTVRFSEERLVFAACCKGLVSFLWKRASAEEQFPSPGAAGRSAGLGQRRRHRRSSAAAGEGERAAALRRSRPPNAPEGFERVPGGSRPSAPNRDPSALLR